MAQKTIFLIASDASESGMMETLPPSQNLKIISEEELKASDLTFGKDDIFSITSESVLETLFERITDEKKKDAIQLLKDKHKFRQLISPLFPEYTYLTASLEELKKFKPTKKMVVKPQKGFFGTGVRTILPDTDMSVIANELQAELSTNLEVFSDTVLSTDTFIIEEYIGGNEYAADIFYDEDGEPHIINLFAHPAPKHSHYVHMLYYTSKEVFEKIEQKVLHFFKKLNEILEVTNFQIHGEFKLDGDAFVPIEMNPTRFGGVGLGNMSYYFTDLNPYDCLSSGQFFDWSNFWENHEEAIYSYLIAYNGKSVNKQTMKPNIERLKNQLGDVIKETHLDYKTQLIFGLFISKESKTNIQKIANLDFDDFFDKI